MGGVFIYLFTRNEKKTICEKKAFVDIGIKNVLRCLYAEQHKNYNNNLLRIRQFSSYEFSLTYAIDLLIQNSVWWLFLIFNKNKTKSNAWNCLWQLSKERLYIYIYCHPQTDCFVLSELFSVARHIGRSKPGSKPIQLYVRLGLIPLGQQAYNVGKRNF